MPDKLYVKNRNWKIQNFLLEYQKPGLGNVLMLDSSPRFIKTCVLWEYNKDLEPDI